AVNPRIVYGSLSGFGADSPYRDTAAHDPNYLALAGVLGLLGRAGEGPVLAGPQIADLSAGLYTTIGILLALRRAEASGVGERLEVSLFDSAFSFGLTAFTSYLANGQAPTRGGERHNGRYPWADIYRTADDRWITVTAIEAQFHANLCRALGHEEWIGEQYAD